jgi:uncharacterized membrane protein/mono/diheme cytochrome c family protein
MWKIAAHSPSWIPRSSNLPDRPVKLESSRRFKFTSRRAVGACSRRRSCQANLPRGAGCAVKSWSPLAAVALTVIAGFRPGIAAAQSGPPVRDIGSEVLGVFATKCAACHGSDLAKPKGRFGYVLDLKRIAANPEMVSSFRPDESELWVLVQRDEMPPADSPQGSLTLAQKEIIRTWIAAGVPEASTVSAESPSSVRSDTTAPSQMEIASAGRILRRLGKFHLLMLHFPIALVLAAGVGEVWSVWRRNPLLSESVRFCLWLGALASIPTAGLGWLYAAAGNGVGSPELLTAHRWLGTSAAVWLVITAVCAERDARRGVRSRGVRLLLAAGVLIMALTAHLGGLLARGADFLTD